MNGMRKEDKIGRRWLTLLLVVMLVVSGVMIHLTGM